MYQGSSGHLEIDELFAYEHFDVAQYKVQFNEFSTDVPCTKPITGPVPLGTTDEHYEIVTSGDGFKIILPQLVPLSYSMLYQTYIPSQGVNVSARDMVTSPGLTACGTNLGV